MWSVEEIGAFGGLTWQMGHLMPGYHTLLGSDVHRDGMYLELIDEATGEGGGGGVFLGYYSDDKYFCFSLRDAIGGN